MFRLGLIFMANDLQELSVIFVPLVLPEQTPMLEVFFKNLRSGLCMHITYSELTHSVYLVSALASSRRGALNCGHVFV